MGLLLRENNSILQPTPEGLYCREGDFYIDPLRPVKHAVVTHAHADHAGWGSASYLCAQDGETVLRARLGDDADIQTLDYGEALTVNGLRLSLHPAGHILGSAQVRIETAGGVCVVTGDIKTHADPTCAPLEPLRCHTLFTESTFGLPIFKWTAPERVIGEIEAWWRENREQSRTSILFAYALGKAQRILAMVDATIGPILTHGAVEKINRCYRDAGVSLPETTPIAELENKNITEGALVIAPPSAENSVWMRRFPQRSTALASGWMRIRGNRRRRSVDRGFVLSDHCDWEGLIGTVSASGADTIGVTHGYAREMVRWLNENGFSAEVVPEAYRIAADADEGKA